MAITTILLIISFKYLMCLHRDKQKLLPILGGVTPSRGKQTTPGKVNKLHRMLRASNILNAKVEYIRPRFQGVNALNFIRFESNSASSLNKKKYISFSQSSSRTYS